MSIPLKLPLEVPCYPDFAPLTLELKDCLHPRLSLAADGVSEFTFSGLYLFRTKYKYRISRNILRNDSSGGKDGGFIICGEQAVSQTGRGRTFFMTPCGAPDLETLETLFAANDYWKNISESVLSPVREKLEKRGIVFTEDRDNFDYLYCRQDLAELKGKKFHKKKNHVNNFSHNYPNHELRQMNTALIPAAIQILDRWQKSKLLQDKPAQDTGEDSDYTAAREALELFNSLALKGAVLFINGQPAAYCLGESIARGRMFAIHFEKAIDEYKGVYQYVNQAFAASLPRFFTLINREQDLGNEGLRQAKMTYRPCDFVRKYTGEPLAKMANPCFSG